MYRLLSLLLSLSHLILTSLAQKGTFTAISFNVAGLPAVFNDNSVPGDKIDNAARIGQLLSQHNNSIIHVPEDFNYHAAIYATDNHPYRTATSRGVPFGSGLNTLSDYNWTEFQRVNGADCLTPKGFTFMRVNIGRGAMVDVYNLHADAGDTTQDTTARASNLRQVSDFIKANSNGNPILVFGDTNSRYTRAADIPTIFITENGMRDAWVELVRSGTAPTPGSDALLCDNPSQTDSCETVDKLWYRGSNALQLSATKFSYGGNAFLQANGSIVSDHNPILVDFAWNADTVGHWIDGPTFGGDDGIYFNDLDTIADLKFVHVANITMRGGDRLNAISTTLVTDQTFSHGGSGGEETKLQLNPGEYLIGATLCSGNKDGETRIFYANVGTDMGRNITAGVRTGTCVDMSAPDYFGYYAFVGRAGDEINQLGFVYGLS